jgi:pimeloyl-ACP methyl ester carboxylesterase
MAIVWAILGWLFTVLFGVFLISMVMLGNWLHALILFLLVLLCLPPFSALLKNRFDWEMHPVLRIVLLAGLLFGLNRVMFGQTPESIYLTPEDEVRFMEIYDEKMEGWPVPYEDLYVDTLYGKVHVIASGPEDAPPMLLLHASVVSSWSWKDNAEDLSQEYRIYAVDLIGDVGKSELDSLEHVMESGKDQAVLYAEIMDGLGIEKAYVVGASEGGFIGSNIAIHYPERVEKLALLGPMGYSGATQAVIRIVLAQMFPLDFVQDSTFRWAFSDSPKLNEEFAEWFPMIMTKYVSTKLAPMPLPAEERQSISVPVMFVFGERDNLVGDPEAAREMVQDMQDVRVEIVPAGHLMAGEIPETCNALLLDFFAED